MTQALHHVLTPGSGPVGLLLVHALGADLRMWDDFVAAWKHPAPILACDLRNAGGSPRSATPITPAEHANDLDAVRRACGLDRVVVVGCAIGAMVAAVFAARYPDSVAGLVMANPALRTAPAARTMLADRAALVQRAGMGALLPGAVERAFLNQPRDARYDIYYARFAAQDAEAYALSCLAVLDADIGEDLRRVSCPSLVVAGAHDVLLPPDLAREVAALLPRSIFELDEKSSHFLPYQDPRGFRDRVAGFLDGAVASVLGAGSRRIT